MNKKGISLIELIASIILVSIVLIFMTRLFISVNGIYNENKFKAEYEMLKSIIINRVASDANKYKLYDIQEKEDGNPNDLLLFFKAERQSDISKNVVKELKIINTSYNNESAKIISYKYYDENNNSDNIYTNLENSENIARVLDKRLKINNMNFSDDGYIFNIKIPISLENGEIFDINMYLKKEQPDE